MVALSDLVRAETATTLAALRRAGVRSTLMLTGDTVPTARHIAAQVGIDDVRAVLLRQDKVAVREVKGGLGQREERSTVR
ncbi:HAD family hydrolase [Georgenia yuyongxinii]|uniref:HAD family hydrolase n=1 Tax=Georgenia yuyongxinii TaxID=2589797 RepID=UPI001E5BFA1D|nr:HAD family hydrolase [Georgenia yuyongxinii]